MPRPVCPGLHANRCKTSCYSKVQSDYCVQLHQPSQSSMAPCSCGFPQDSFPVVALKPRASLLLRWLPLVVSLTCLGICSCSEPLLEGEWTSDFGDAWTTYNSDSEDNLVGLPSLVQTFTMNPLEELYEIGGATRLHEGGESGASLLAADADPEENVSLEGAEANRSPPPAAPRITGQKRITTGLIAMVAGVLLAAYFIHLYKSTPRKAFDALKRHGYVVQPKANSVVRLAATILDVITLSFLMVLTGFSVVAVGLISRHRSKAKATEWLMEQLATTAISTGIKVTDIDGEAINRDWINEEQGADVNAANIIKRTDENGEAIKEGRIEDEQAADVNAANIIRRTDANGEAINEGRIEDEQAADVNAANIIEAINTDEEPIKEDWIEEEQAAGANAANVIEGTDTDEEAIKRDWIEGEQAADANAPNVAEVVDGDGEAFKED